VQDTSTVKNIRYDDEAIAHYKNILNKNPKYPFPYYLLAEAYHLRGDIIWLTYAQKAIDILKITTSIPNHAPNHDQALSNLRVLIETNRTK